MEGNRRRLIARDEVEISVEGDKASLSGDSSGLKLE